ncbi:MAG: hypothetical protein ACI855_000752 [Myxococcota bacterium]
MSSASMAPSQSLSMLSSHTSIAPSLTAGFVSSQSKPLPSKHWVNPSLSSSFRSSPTARRLAVASGQGKRRCSSGSSKRYRGGRQTNATEGASVGNGQQRTCTGRTALHCKPLNKTCSLRQATACQNHGFYGVSSALASHPLTPSAATHCKTTVAKTPSPVTTTPSSIPDYRSPAVLSPTD